MLRTARDWVIDRFALAPIHDALLDRRVPKAPWYAGDGSTLLALLGIQVITGAVLALTYSPAADSAYASVVHISDEQTLGWLVRALHYWSAGAMMVMVAFHLLRQLLMAGYKSPREGTWLVGVLLLVAVMLLSYTGYLLRWDERSIHGIRVMLHMLHRLPLVGDSLVLLVQGGPELGAATLTRLYATHVLIIPLGMFLLVAFHVYLVVMRGTMTRAERQQPVESAEQQRQLYKEEAASAAGGERFFPVTMLKTSVMTSLVIGLVLVTSLLAGPQPLMDEATLTADSQPAEEWWYWWFSGLIALLPAAIAPWFVVVFPLLVLVVLLAVPWLDRSPHRSVGKRPFWLLLVVLIVLALLALSDYRRRSAFTGWPDPEPPLMPVGMQLPPRAEQGRLLFAQYGCNSCHGIGGRGRRLAVDFAMLTGQLSRDKIRQYILRPPPEVAMPGYEDRLDEEELVALVEFCHVVQTFPLQD